MDGEFTDFLDEDREPVFGADRGSSGGDDNVRAVFEEGGFNFIFVVGEAAGHFEDGAVSLEQGGEHGGVAVDDAGAAGGFSGVEELVAGGEESDFGLADDGDLGLTDAGEDADVLGAELSPGLKEDLIFFDVFADAADVFARAYGGGGHDLGFFVGVIFGAVFGFEDSVSAVGDRGAGHDTDTLAGSDLAFEGFAGEDFADEGEGDGVVEGGPEAVFGLDCVAVHGGASEGGDVDGACDLFGEDPVGG